MHDPCTHHMAALKQIIQYIKGTPSYALHLSSTSNYTLLSYTDADWGGCPNTSLSTSGYCVYLGDNLISWSTKHQPTLSHSNAEVEYRGVANVVSESVRLRNLLLELQCPLTKVTLIYCDNVSVVSLSNNPVQYQRTKHIEMDIHFVLWKSSSWASLCSSRSILFLKSLILSEKVFYFNSFMISEIVSMFVFLPLQLRENIRWIILWLFLWISFWYCIYLFMFCCIFDLIRLQKYFIYSLSSL